MLGHQQITETLRDTRLPFSSFSFFYFRFWLPFSSLFPWFFLPVFSLFCCRFFGDFLNVFWAVSFSFSRFPPIFSLMFATTIPQLHKTTNDRNEGLRIAQTSFLFYINKTKGSRRKSFAYEDHVTIRVSPLRCMSENRMGKKEKIKPEYLQYKSGKKRRNGKTGRNCNIFPPCIFSCFRWKGQKIVKRISRNVDSWTKQRCQIKEEKGRVETQKEKK